MTALRQADAGPHPSLRSQQPGTHDINAPRMATTSGQHYQLTRMQPHTTPGAGVNGTWYASAWPKQLQQPPPTCAGTVTCPLAKPPPSYLHIPSVDHTELQSSVTLIHDAYQKSADTSSIWTGTSIVLAVMGTANHNWLPQTCAAELYPHGKMSSFGMPDSS